MSAGERRTRMGLCALMTWASPLLGRTLAEFGAEALWAGLLADGEESTFGRRAAAIDLDELERATAACGARFLIPGDDEWPTSLNDLGERVPTALWVRGAVSFLTAPLSDRVTITGARAATCYGEHVTTELASNLTHAERIIVAGGAYGIDAAAHRAALATGGQTLAVMVGGLDRLYPSGNRELLARVGDLGLLASEMPPGSAPTKWRFLARNRILGALSGATVVVEAGYRSSSLNVAARATQLGRPVGAVPGPVTSAASSGTHRLLREGIASLITDATDVTALLDSPAGGGGQAFARESGITPSAHREGRAL